jgi:hypothetical protein
MSGIARRVAADAAFQHGSSRDAAPGLFANGGKRQVDTTANHPCARARVSADRDLRCACGARSRLRALARPDRERIEVGLDFQRDAEGKLRLKLTQPIMNYLEIADPAK